MLNNKFFRGNFDFPTYCTMMLLAFIGSFLVLPTAKMVNNVYYALIFLPVLVSILIKKYRKFTATPEGLLWLTLLVCYLLVGLKSADWQHFKAVAYVALFIYTASHLVSPILFRSSLYRRTQFWVLVTYIIGSTIIYWITGKYNVGERILWLPSRLNGPIYTSILLASCLALATPAWIESKKHFALSAAIALTIFAIGYCLQSRSGLVGLFLLLALYIIRYSISRDPKRLKIILAVILLISSVTSLCFIFIPELSTLFSRGDSMRFELWNSLINSWRTCGWWLGCGLAFKSEHSLTGGAPIAHPHNIFLAFGLYSGLATLLIFITLMFITLLRAWRNRDPWGLYLAVALLCLNFDGSKLIGNPDELWLLVLLPAALIINKNYQKSGAVLT